MNDNTFDHTFEVTRENFQSEVIEASQSLPIVLVFFAPQVPASAELAQSVKQLAQAYAGAFRLGLVDMSRDPGLGQAMRVQGLPSVRAVKGGSLAGALDGAQPESELRRLIDGLTMSSSEILREQLGTYVEREDYANAIELVQQALREEPNNKAFLVELADLLVLDGKPVDAKQVLDRIPEETAGRSRVAARLELMSRASELDDLATLRTEYEQVPDDSDRRYELAVKLAAANKYEEALDLGLALLMHDRQYGDDAGRKFMLEVFEVLGKGSALAQKFRRKMFNYLH